MRQRTVFLVALLMAVLAVSAPVAAEGPEEGDVTSCVKIKTEPPSVVVDPGCILPSPLTWPPDP